MGDGDGEAGGEAGRFRPRPAVGAACSWGRGGAPGGVRVGVAGDPAGEVGVAGDPAEAVWKVLLTFLLPSNSTIFFTTVMANIFCN